MAGVKGKSGGPRENAGGARKNSGGVRPGAGRKPKEKKPVEPIKGNDTLKLLQDIAFGRIEASNIQVRAAIAAVQYTHTKRSDGGKKEGQVEKAKKAAGKFSSTAPPKLAAANGKRI